MNKFFWTKEHNELINNFNKNINNNYYFNQLYQVLNIMIDICMKSLGIKAIDYDDIRQDCLMRLYTKILPNITEEKSSTSQQYVYISLRNYLKSYYLNKKKLDFYTYFSGIDDEVEEFFNYNNVEEHIDINDTKVEIIEALDNKLNNERIVNTDTFTFLNELKNYLLENNFDERGFKDYIMNKNVFNKKYLYMRAANLLNIRTDLFIVDVMNKRMKGSITT